jgi:hypothetical protein
MYKKPEVIRSDRLGSVQSWAAWTVIGIGIGNLKGRFHEDVSYRVTLGDEWDGGPNQ